MAAENPPRRPATTLYFAAKAPGGYIRWRTFLCATNCKHNPVWFLSFFSGLLSTLPHKRFTAFTLDTRPQKTTIEEIFDDRVWFFPILKWDPPGRLSFRRCCTTPLRPIGGCRNLAWSPVPLIAFFLKYILLSSVAVCRAEIMEQQVFKTMKWRILLKGNVILPRLKK